MTTEQKRKILKRIAQLSSDIEKLEGIRLQLASAEYVSATMSSGGGSKSYTRADIDKISKAIKELKQELKNSRKLLNGDSQVAPQSIYTVYV